MGVNGPDRDPGKPQDAAELENELEDAAAERDLAADLDRARTEAAEHYDRLLRAQAELQNVIRRHERERGERARYACEALARDLLPIVDDLDRALQHAGDQGRGLTQGVELVYKALVSTFERHGIKRIDSVGKPFDPSQHEAVAVVDSPEVPENTVVQEHRAGYCLHDRLLRPAMVAVARQPADDTSRDY